MTSFCDFGNIISLVSTNYTLELRKCFPLCYTKTKNITIKVVTFMQKGDSAKLKLLLAGISARLTKNRDFFVQADCTLVSGKKKFDAKLLLLCKQAAKNFHTICKKETALKRVLSNLLSAVSLLRFKAVFSCGFRVPPGSGLYQSCAAGSVCIPAGQKYCSPRPRKSCPADRKTPGLPSRCIGHRW